MRTIGIFLLFLLHNCTFALAGDKSQQFLFSHGLGSNREKVKLYQRYNIVPHNTVALSYPDARRQIRWMPLVLTRLMTSWRSSLGQMPDVQCLAQALNSSQEEVVAFGESRGASTILNLLGSGFPEAHKILAAVLDAPFDSVEHAIEHRLHQATWLRKIVSAQTLHRFIPYFFWAYQREGMQPINSVDSISLEKPLLLIGSEEDEIASWIGIAKLYKRLRNNGHTKVHLLILPHGKHGRILNGKCGKLYRNVVHAFYRTYDFEYNSEYANAGSDFFSNQCQPTAQQIDDAVTKSSLFNS